ncbi:GAF and ANTAR domain-containing protein [Pseudonocardia spinosispora]|uniref:GAF and ANTAR domain-containing protein n=1 Tax=Pseudonocardia spinosispora TaxID=103441 RepID=UPI000564278A|nr:GAF and ANTAR domain-containing protein [Pseudonocardia spinosispora]
MQGAATKAVLAIARDVPDDRGLAERICRAYVEGLDVDGAALSLLTATDSRLTLHATDPTADVLEELQFTLNEGICIEAATTGRPVFVSDIRTATARWPMFTATLLETTPVRALFALPLQWGTTNLGVLDLYRLEPDGLGDAERMDALAAAEAATLMMLTLRTDSGELVDARGSWLDPMVAGRAEIHQATGMVLAQLGVPADHALARMRAHAFAEQRLLIDVARDVVARRLSFTDEGPR